jgi:hypothetical protein
MSAVAETLAVALGVNGVAGWGVTAYTVRRLAAWPKPPAPAQPAAPRSRRAAGTKEDEAAIAQVVTAGHRAWEATHPPAADGSVVPGVMP